MIDIIQDIFEQINGIEAVQGRVYRKWPKTKAKLPSVLISRISAIPTQTDADGSEVAAQLTYSIDINATDADAADAIAEAIGDRLARYNLHRSGDTEFYDDTFRAHRRILTFYAVVDARGNTFTNRGDNNDNQGTDSQGDETGRNAERGQDLL